MKDMKRNIKKYKKIGLIALTILVIVVIYKRYLPTSIRFSYDFIKHIDDYNVMAEIYYEDYKKNNTNEVLIYTAPESGIIYRYRLYVDNIEIVLCDEETESCQRACEHYRKVIGEDIDVVAVYDTFVSFEMRYGYCSIVYSAEDKRPFYINSPNSKDKNVIVRKIANHWYYVYKFMLFY